jgi:hypothetical protein
VYYSVRATEPTAESDGRHGPTCTLASTSGYIRPGSESLECTLRSTALTSTPRRRITLEISCKLSGARTALNTSLHAQVPVSVICATAMCRNPVGLLDRTMQCILHGALGSVIRVGIVVWFLVVWGCFVETACSAILINQHASRVGLSHGLVWVSIVSTSSYSNHANVCVAPL